MPSAMTARASLSMLGLATNGAKDGLAHGVVGAPSDGRRLRRRRRPPEEVEVVGTVYEGASGVGKMGMYDAAATSDRARTLRQVSRSPSSRPRLLPRRVACARTGGETKERMGAGARAGIGVGARCASRARMIPSARFTSPRVAVAAVRLSSTSESLRDHRDGVVVVVGEPCEDSIAIGSTCSCAVMS
ncbi:hypothetical protein C8J57DRAFT_1339777 [Mycena rebaudengoi]|nr:hypothetical protein C8J57DRAFT_1339777 [Mycena rebaudengoi]